MGTVGATRRRATTLAILVAMMVISMMPARADTLSLVDTRDGGRLDIRSIAHRHGSGDEIVYRVTFHERFRKRLLVRRFELYFEGRRGTTSPFTSPSTLVYGRTMRDEHRIFMRLAYFDVEMATRRLADVRLRKRPRSVIVRFPHSLISSTTPFTYRWIARTEFKPRGEPRIEDLTRYWLGHRIEAA